MHDFPKPTNTTELRGFLGPTRYYWKFVKHYGIVAKPLTNLLKKKQFSWNDQPQQAFEQLKAEMATTPVLALPNFNQQFILETNACDTCIGVVLMRQKRPIAYLRKPLAPAH
jgi:hypothetical protein